MNITEKDLMVGDLVQYGDIHPIKTRVLAISSVDNGKHWHIQVEPESQNSIRIVAMHAVEPIPLTIEILEKNGFVKNRYGEIELNDELGTSEINLVLEPTYSEEYYWWRINNNLIAKIKYVHELQHIMKLVGIDKTIEL